MTRSMMNGVGGYGYGPGDFADPFADMASQSMPQDWKSAMKWCEYIFQANASYRMAMERIISYFLTDIEISDVDSKEREAWETFLYDTLAVIKSTQDAMRNRMCYGNDIATLIVPFKRFLVCPKCHSQYLLKEVADHSIFRYKWTDYEFHATCPSCATGSGYTGAWKINDEPADEQNKIRVKHWSVHEIELLHDPATDEVAYLWRIPEDYKQMVRKGHLFHLERVSQEVLKAIKNNWMFRFNDDAVFHMKEPCLAGMRNRGWGIPRTLTSFRQIYYVQVLKRYNEAIALDYVIPFRLITPVPRGGAGGAVQPEAMDPLMTVNMGDFSRQVRRMIRSRRRDPAGWNTLPFPVQYQALGGDATQLAPRELLDQGEEALLNGVGVPMDLYRGSLQMQSAPVATRLFEATFHHLVRDANEFISWLVTSAARILRWEAPTVRLKRATHADDLNRTMMALQMSMAQKLSGTSGLASLGFNWEDEQKRLAEEMRKQIEIQQELQKQMERAGLGAQISQGGAPGQPPGQPGAAPAPPGAPGAAPAGGAGAPPAGGPIDPMTGMPARQPVTEYIQTTVPNQQTDPQTQAALADQLATELLGLSESVKDSELRKLKEHNESLHQAVRDRMDEKRKDARNQGGAAVMQAQYGGGAAA